MSLYSRRLPHWHPSEKPLFITWRLKDTLPAGRHFSSRTIKAGEAFVTLDRLLDRADTGPSYLRHPEIADLVVQVIRDGQNVLQYYKLHAFVVMPNHVHLLITPKVHVATLMQQLKGLTSRRANQLLRQTGKPFWQQESYDHWVRDNSQFGRIQSYIEENPVRAGYAARAEAYQWSSAWGRLQPATRL